MMVSFTGLGIVPLIWIFTGEVSAFDHAANWILTLFGAILFAWSMVLFRITHKALGAMWSVSLDLREGHKLVTSGIYEKVRHPMYSAFWLWAVAQPFLLSNWIAGFSGIIGFGTLYFLRVGQEEKMMEQEFGDQYRDYCQRTKRIIPGIF
ncbi:MAG: isoprenylcysteine carboxylmethyltransferase family protein [Hyphomicrobiales bacterium]|nr:isoprenylcysteine carboxylmethyltransferase family protein [Hyphomicrobiales bacterium]